MTVTTARRPSRTRDSNRRWNWIPLAVAAAVVLAGASVAAAAPAATGGGSVLSVSCSSAGNCDAGGYLQPVEFMARDPPVGDPPPLDSEGSFVASAKNGHWGSGRYVAFPGMNQVNSLSCTAVGDCSAGGLSSAVPSATTTASTVATARSS